MTKPGFHFALIFSPKKEPRNASDRHYRIYHAINTIQSVFKSNLNSMQEWRYEHKAINGPREGTITGRVLIVKLPTHELLATRAERMRGILAQVLFVQNDVQWDCRAWMIHALAALRANGNDFSTILDVTNGVQVDGELKAFGDMAKDRVLKRRPSCVSDMPHSDMKVDRKCVPDIEDYYYLYL
ncbi:hypothetical protein F4604DRAFT_1920541 [Suillus subluteus]|nr:hypothetical protein F4604DRAFT_1920541 [Suillus subluteus]